MKDSIRFICRGKRTDTGEWVVGNLIILDGLEYRIATSSLTTVQNKQGTVLEVCAYEVDPSTICRCVGILDKHENLIFEYDICRYYNEVDKDGIGIIKEDYVSWANGTIRSKESMTPLFYLKCSEEWEVLGNIFDNEDLLKNSL